MTADDGRILDLGTKGSGTTPFSRTADGRLTLKGAVREILATEMLEALGDVEGAVLALTVTGRVEHFKELLKLWCRHRDRTSAFSLVKALDASGVDLPLELTRAVMELHH